MPKPASVAWRPWNGGDQIWIVTANSVGAIIAYSTIAPDVITEPLQWNSQQIAAPGSTGLLTATRASEAPAIAFGGFGTRFLPPNGVHVAASGPNGVAYYSNGELVHNLDGLWPSQIISGATGSVVGIAVMPDDYVYILTVSTSQELIGWLGRRDIRFVQMPVPTAGTPNPAPAAAAAMTVRSVNVSQVEVHVIAGQQFGAPANNQLTYFWSTYTAGSGSGAGSFGPWQSNNIAAPTPPGCTEGYPDWPVSIALGPTGEVVVTAGVQGLAGKIAKGSYLYYFLATSPGSSWNNMFIVGPSGALDLWTSSGGVAVDGSGTAHSLVILSNTRAFIPGSGLTNQPSVTDYTFAEGETLAGQIPVDTPNSTVAADPLDWTNVSWSDKGYSLGGPTYNYWGQDIVPGMTVRANGEVDVAFWNFPFSSVVLFSLAPGSNKWVYGLVGNPDQ